jgi:hypothetical protein
MISAHLVRSGLSERISGQIVSNISKWISSSGLEWTVKRLKDIKSYYLQGLAGSPEDKAAWLAVDDEGLPKGPFKHIFRLKNPRRALDALMSYTNFTFSSVTVGQSKKFFDSVTSEPVVVPYIPWLKKVVEELPKKSFHRGSDWFETYPFTGTKRTPWVKGSLSNTPFTLGKESHLSIVHDLWEDFPQVFGDFFSYLVPGFSESPLKKEISYPYVGRIACVQERGGKARFIANPLLTVQCLSYPLGMYLFRLLKGVDWDCTYDQEKGVRWGQRCLSEGKRLFSVDLSDFTNNFPRDLVYRVLQWLPIPDYQLEFYSCMLDSKWDARSFGIEELYWTKGTPLGLYPSFPAFALTHGCILRSIEQRYGLRDTFKVLGDDVLISNPLVNLKYRRLLCQLECPVSESKTITGDIGEFAGNVITRTGSFRPQKIPKPGTPFVRGLYQESTLGKVKTDYGLLAYAITNLNRPENPEGLPLKSRALLAYLFGLISIDSLERDLYVATGPWTWNTTTLLYKYFLDSVQEMEVDSFKDLRQQSTEWYEEFLDRNPAFRTVITLPTRKDWFKSLTEELPVFLRAMPESLTYKRILHMAVDKAVKLQKTDASTRERLCKYLESMYLSSIA